MALETTTTAPQLADFTPLSEHQEQTPSAFYGAKPILHLHSPDASVTLSHADLEAQPAFKDLIHDSAPTQPNGDSPPDNLTITGLDIWVASHHLTLFSPAKSRGVHIPYPSIVVHAAEGDEVLLGLNLSDSNTPDEDMVFVQLRLTPKTSRKHASNIGARSTEATAQPADLALFSAISACQELNPDPPESDEGEGGGGGGFDETAPGATGWITSENMAEFVDKNGEFKVPEGVAVVGGAEDGLGEGAGRTRTADEVDGEEEGEGEAKWQRTG